MNDTNLALRMQLAACLGTDLGMHDLPGAPAREAFPKLGDTYGYAEMYWFLGWLVDEAITHVEQQFQGNLSDFWDYWVDVLEGGVFTYDASAALIQELTKCQHDPVTFGDPCATAKTVAKAAMTKLLDPQQIPQSVEDDLSSQISTILTT
jgi:hypothetical protein